MSDFSFFLKIFTTLFSVFLVTLGLTWLIWHQARRKRWLAIPNERSSHQVPTPSGGGLAVAAVFLFNVVVLGLVGTLEKKLALALFGGGLIIAVISWIDDLRPLRARYRIFVHALAAIWALWWFGGMPTLDLGFKTIYLGILGTIPAFLWIVWMSNLYNFMDGIDGLIGAEAVMIGGIAGLLLFFFSGAWSLALIVWVLAATAGGFLIWNWPPAKIFMGDVGSVLLGYSFSIFALASEQIKALPLLVWVILLMLFIVDATLTTVRRMIKKERWFEAHHTFAYQRVLRKGLNHGQVTIRAMALNIILIFSVFVSLWQPRFLLPIFLICLLLFSLIWWKIQKQDN